MTPEMPSEYGRERRTLTLEITDRAPLTLLPFLHESVDRLLEDAGKLNEAEIHAPSSLPGWSRAHVIAHLAGSADSRLRLLVAARTGLPIPQYPSERFRTEQIEKDIKRLSAELLARLRSSTSQVLTAIRDHPRAAWHRPVRWLGGTEHPVHRVVSSLVQELEIHHVDLDTGYTPDDWPGWFAADQCRKVIADFAERDDMPGMWIDATDEGIRHDFGPGPLVTGRSRELLAWLVGRSDGAGLTVIPAGPLPELPPWRQ